MSKGIEELKASLQDKMGHLETRLAIVKSRIHQKSEETQAVLKNELAKAKASRDSQKAKFEAAKQRLSDGFEAKKSETEQKIAEWKTAREIKKLTKRADRAEDYAADSILLAVAALDEADCATLEAIEARIVADEAAAGA